MAVNRRNIGANQAKAMIKPDERVLRAITLANLAPKGAEISDYLAFLVEQGISIDRSKILEGSVEYDLLPQWLKAIKKWPRLYKFLTSMNEDDRPDQNPSWVIVLFGDFLHSHTLLHSLTDYSETYRHAKETGGYVPLGPVIPFSRFVANKDTNALTVEAIWPSELIVGLDLTRFRRCIECTDIFWAFRGNQKYCSDNCRIIYLDRQRRNDAARRSSINERRRRNYAYKRGKSGGKRNGPL